jgi:hypothetical protein
MYWAVSFDTPPISTATESASALAPPSKYPQSLFEDTGLHGGKFWIFYFQVDVSTDVLLALKSTESRANPKDKDAITSLMLLTSEV